ncbi:MAG: D-alanyl-D-alanine carboxypeptidase, partial [Saprospiraceae bacterium]|nr:D-alanyl-D-alanine carboxypeptidase [Saprospiraceae bacterium]
WLFAKTGSMGGVVCISGYLRTRRGKTLIFSFMNNNFVGSAKPWRLEMRRILELVAGH